MSLRESAAPFSRLSEPSEMAYEVAGTVEDMLLKPRLHAYTVTELARAIETDLATFNKRYIAMETALAFASQLAQIHGANAEEMRRIWDMVAEGDKK